MKRGTENLLQCPKCRSEKFTLVVNEETVIEVREGYLECGGCGMIFPISAGIPQLVDELPKEVQSEMHQWEIFADSEGWLNPPDEYLNALPSQDALKFIPGDTITWHRHEANFNLALQDIDIRGKLLLDLGAGRCWSTKLLALRGAQCYACDVLSHPKIGLGAADVLMSRNSIFFERLVADMNNIPFQKNTFDVIFVSGSLHHTLDLKRTVREISRVLKKGGRFILTNEACGGGLAREKCQMTGTQEGINEHAYRLSRYFSSLIRSRFWSLEVIPSTGFLDPSDSYFGGQSWVNRVKAHRLWYLVFLFIRGGVLVLRAIKK